MALALGAFARLALWKVPAWMVVIGGAFGAALLGVGWPLLAPVQMVWCGEISKLRQRSAPPPANVAACRARPK